MKATTAHKVIVVMHVVTEFLLGNKIFLNYFCIWYFYFGCLLERNCWGRKSALFEAADFLALSRNTAYKKNLSDSVDDITASNT